MSSVGSPRRQDGRTEHGPNTIRSNRTNLRVPGPVPIRSIWAGSTAHCTTSKSVVPYIQPSSRLVTPERTRTKTHRHNDPQTQGIARSVGTILQASIPLRPAPPGYTYRRSVRTDPSSDAHYKTPILRRSRRTTSTHPGVDDAACTTNRSSLSQPLDQSSSSLRSNRTISRRSGLDPAQTSKHQPRHNRTLQSTHTTNSLASFKTNSSKR